jgi:hypothetical protein
MIYLLNLLFVVAYYIILRLAISERGKCEKYFAILVGIHATLFRALINPDLTPDHMAYFEAFDWIRFKSFKEVVLSNNYLSEWGRGFLLLNWLISRFTDDGRALYIICALICVPIEIWFYYKNTHYMLYPILLYLSYPMTYCLEFSAIRQGLCISFLLVALHYVEYKRSILLALLATLMHTSGIVFFPFYLWRKIDWYKISLLKLVVSIAICYIIYRLSLASILLLLPRYARVAMFSGSNLLPFFWIAAIVILSIFCKTYQMTESKRERTLLSFIYYGLAISFICIGAYDMGRFTCIFMYVIPAVSMILIKYSPYSYYNILVMLCGIVCTLYNLWGQTLNEYKFIWENV